MGASDSKPLDQEPEEAQHISSVRVRHGQRIAVAAVRTGSQAHNMIRKRFVHMQVSPELLQQLAGQEQAPGGRASHAAR